MPRLHRSGRYRRERHVAQTVVYRRQIAVGLQPDVFPSSIFPSSIFLFCYARSSSSSFREILPARRVIMASGTNHGTKTSIRGSFARTPRRRAATCQTVVRPNRAWSAITTRLKWMALGFRYQRKRFRIFQHRMEGPTFVRRRRWV